MTAVKIGIVQRSPAYYNKQKTLALAADIIDAAHQEGTNLLVFGESWFAGYPVWLDCYPNVARWDDPTIKKVYRSMFDSSLPVPGDEISWLCDRARSCEMAIVMGFNEVAGDTLYNSVITIDEHGKLGNHHRKLMPTYTEKMVHGLGDGAGLNSVQTSFGRITASICWEHWMPLTRQALHAEGEDIHIALWPKVHEMHQVASRHYAFEGRCWVVAVGQMVHRDQMPDLLKDQEQPEDEWLLNGGSAIINPRGQYLLEPQYGRDEVIYTKIEDVQSRIEEVMTLDVTGHYHRPDVFKLSVNRERDEEASNGQA